MNIKQVIVIRTDLNMRKGKMVAQGAHASMKVLIDKMYDNENTNYSSLELGVDDDWDWPVVKQWINGTFTKICVGIGSEFDFHTIHQNALRAKLPCAVIQDNGYTEFHGVPTYTALAIGPAESEKIDEITGHLKLL